MFCDINNGDDNDNNNNIIIKAALHNCKYDYTRPQRLYFFLLLILLMQSYILPHGSHVFYPTPTTYIQCFDFHIYIFCFFAQSCFVLCFHNLGLLCFLSFFFDSVNDLKRPNTVHKTVNTDSYLILPFFFVSVRVATTSLLFQSLLVSSLFSFLPLLILRLVLVSVFHHNRTRVYDNDYVFFSFLTFFLFLLTVLLLGECFYVSFFLCMEFLLSRSVFFYHLFLPFTFSAYTYVCVLFVFVLGVLCSIMMFLT